MGRERKPQGGNFNRSASGRTGPPPGSARTPSAELVPSPVKFKPTSLVQTSVNKFLDLPEESSEEKMDVYMKRKRDVSGM